MKKRLAAAALWLYTGWYAGAFVAGLLGISELIGPVLGAAGAAFFAGDPRHIIWTKRATEAASDPGLPAATNA